MDLDVGINRLIHYLDEQGELDNTAFVFYADHNAYYHDLQYSMRGIAQSESWNTDLYHIPFFIWSGSCMNLDVVNAYEGVAYSNAYDGVYFDSVYEGEYYYSLHHEVPDPIGGVRIEKGCNSFDLLPTILDLFGYDFKTAMYQGISVFKNEESVFISREAGIMYADMYSDGEMLYIMADRTESGDFVSRDGQIVFSGDTVTVVSDGEEKVYSASSLRKKLYVYSGSRDYSVYNISSASAYLSDNASEFLIDVNAHYAKQVYLEEIYKNDYFSDHDFSGFLRKI